MSVSRRNFLKGLAVGGTAGYFAMAGVTSTVMKDMFLPDEPVGDDIILVMREYGREFLEAVGPAIAEAFDRVFLERLRKGDYKWADRDRPPVKVIGVDMAPKPAVIEDIEL